MLVSTRDIQEGGLKFRCLGPLNKDSDSVNLTQSPGLCTLGNSVIVSSAYSSVHNKLSQSGRLLKKQQFYYNSQCVGHELRIQAAVGYGASGGMMLHTARHIWHLVRMAGKMGSAAATHLSTLMWPLSAGTPASYMRSYSRSREQEKPRGSL